MYLLTINYNNVKSYFIPSFHFNIDLIFSEDEIKIFENIIQNSDIVLLESNDEKPKKIKNHHQIK
jgi:hypothetical protein